MFSLYVPKIFQSEQGVLFDNLAIYVHNVGLLPDMTDLLGLHQRINIAWTIDLCLVLQVPNKYIFNAMVWQN